MSPRHVMTNKITLSMWSFHDNKNIFFSHTDCYIMDTFIELNTLLLYNEWLNRIFRVVRPLFTAGYLSILYMLTEYWFIWNQNIYTYTCTLHYCCQNIYALFLLMLLVNCCIVYLNLLRLDKSSEGQNYTEI